MTLFVISDTHIPEICQKIPDEFLSRIKDEDVLFHAGDFTNLETLRELERRCKLYAVHGNMDRQKVSGALPKINSLKIFNWKIGVMHDPNTPFGKRIIREIATQNGFDVFVYGHTHSSKIKWEGKKLYINPGSPTDPDRPYINKPSVGLLTVTKQKIKPEIIFF